ncbi:WD repeat-containing protein GTS1 isoform X2 [Macadamia integrifolia]|uniref:WD repeat-containing protein GTS1 isoform X2 n=1 Tax=Macadamia integrifolia TaxID=60698 RepID=UPI001C4F02EB|nr:WD repeat-containing protein GTS1 isoform X2 [Macadamia integrifolia]
MEETGMEIDESTTPATPPNSQSFKRFGIKNSIQTNFGDDYVFQIDLSKETSTMAVSLSTNTIKLYSPGTGQYLGECKGHSSTINQISFSSPSSPYVLHSCSSDGTVRGWDTRSFKQILFWDWRSGKQVACLEESHMDDVTQVHFVPDHKSKLISASVDGLMCFFNTDGDISDDDHLEAVMNVGTSIGKVGFFGEMNQKLWCLTHIETLSVWDWRSGDLEANFENARSLASDNWTMDHVDYFVDCHYSGANDTLWVIGGTNVGTLGYFPVSYRGQRTIGSPEAILEGGHEGIVRTVLPMSDRYGGPTLGQDMFGWTGGEDGRLCCWLSDESSEIKRSWISSELVMKSLRTHKNRHRPY